MVQVAPAAKTEGHLFRSVSDGSPCKETFAIPTEAPLVFVTVVVWTGLSPIVYPLLNVTAGGEKLNAPGMEPVVDPVPLSKTVCAPVARLMVSVPVRVPVAVGVKVTVTVQVLPAARDAVQVVVSAKSPVAVAP